MTWKDKAAINVMTTTARIKLLKTLNVDDDSILLKKMEHLFAFWEIEVISSKETRLARVKKFIELMTSRMTTKLFMSFIDSLDDKNLAKELLEIYVKEDACTALSTKD